MVGWTKPGVTIRVHFAVTIESSAESTIFLFLKITMVIIRRSQRRFKTRGSLLRTTEYKKEPIDRSIRID